MIDVIVHSYPITRGTRALSNRIGDILIAYASRRSENNGSISTDITSLLQIPLELQSLMVHNLIGGSVIINKHKYVRVFFKKSH